MKKILIMILVIALVAAAGLIYFYFFYGAASPPGGGAAGGTPGQPPAGGGEQTPPGAQNAPPPSNLSQAAPNPALDYFIDGQNNLYLIQTDGQVIETAKGQAATLSSSPISNLFGASFSYDGQKILAAFGDPQKPQLSVFDVVSKSWQPLPAGLGMNAVWSPIDYRVAYVSTASNVVTLYTLDTAKAAAKPQALIKLHALDLSASWPAANQIFLSDKGSAFTTASVWSFDVKKGVITPVLADQRGFDVLWSTGSNEGLDFSTTISGRGGALKIIDKSGNSLHGLTFLTLPEKCVFTPPAAAATSSVSLASSILYCAVPRDAQKLKIAQLPDDYKKKVIYTSDDFYKINLGSGHIDLLFGDQSQNLDATNIKTFGGKLFFLNRYDQKVYSLKF